MLPTIGRSCQKALEAFWKGDGCGLESGFGRFVEFGSCDLVTNTGKQISPPSSAEALSATHRPVRNQGRLNSPIAHGICSSETSRWAGAPVFSVGWCTDGLLGLLGDFGMDVPP